jgi:hypothetical protein
MSSRTTFIDLIKSRWSVVRRYYAFPWGGPQVVTIASALHLFLAICLFIVGRAEIAPTLVDRNGIMASFAFDSYTYQSAAVQLAELLQNGRLVDWATAAQPIHVKFIALPFALLGPVFGYNTLSAEPYNLLCYAAVVGLVFALGREVRGRRAGLLASAAVAVWPSFLLHTLQLLKDPLFIAGSVVFVLCATTLLTRAYGPTLAAGVTALTILMLLLLFLVRGNAVMVILAIGLISFALLLLRQWLQRRLLLWNMMSSVAVLLTTLLLMSVYSAQRSEKVKQFPSDHGGQPKFINDVKARIPSLLVRVPTVTRPRTSAAVAPGWRGGANMVARRISGMRSRFAASYPDAGSILDGSQEFRSWNDLAGYVPRAVEIGLWAPFPYTWVSAGRRVGSPGRLLAAAETILIYLCQLLAVLAVAREPRRMALWFLLAIALLGVTALALVVPNVGALYRLRYTFWIPVIIAATACLDNFLTAGARRSRARQRSVKSAQRPSGELSLLNLYRPMNTFRGFAVTIILACTLASATACSSFRRLNREQGSRAEGASKEVSAQPGFRVNNFTGTSLSGLYLSPTTSSGWEENVLGWVEMKDGEIVDIRFNPNEKTTTWDMRIESGDGHYAEWKNLNLGDVSEITLLLKLTSGTTAVAELQ